MIDVKIPEVGESIVEVQIGEWLKAEGDPVMKDDSLAVVESEKTNFELPSPASGRLGRILAQAGQTVKVGATVAQIEPGNEAGQPEAATAPVTQKASTQAAPQAQPSPKAAAPEPLHKPVRPPKEPSQSRPARLHLLRKWPPLLSCHTRSHGRPLPLGAKRKLSR